MRIYDCFPFFNEFDQLRLRIALLEDLVDRFVVIEAHQTHTGKPKPLYLSESGAADLLQHPKVVARAVDLPVGYSDWEREQHQRESIGGVLQEIGARPEDLVLVSDVDEIPARAALLRAREVTLPRRFNLGGLRLGYAGRGQWPRLPLNAGRGSAGA